MKLSRGLTVAAVAGILVLATALVGASPIVDAATGLKVTDAGLTHSAAFTVLAPFCTLLDGLTLLSLRQHVAVLATLAVVVLAWRVVRAWSPGAPSVSAWREAGIALLALLGFVLVYAVGAVVPRPMAAISAHDPEDVVIDFHSHTNFSWDGRKWFTAERNRAWHANSGFNVAYVADHKSLRGAMAGARGNPARAGDATVLLPAIEARDHYEHIIAIGIDSAFAFDPKGNWTDPVPDTSLAVPQQAPLLILTIPGNLDKLPQNELTGFARLYAVELSDGAPKGIGEIQRRRSDILGLADTLNLAVVAGSDNHGWGSTAAGWSVMRIPGWASMSPAQLDTAVQRGIRINRRQAVRVYVRDSPDAGSSVVAASLTVPLVIWRVLVNLDWPERISWLGWIVLIASIATMLSSRAARDTMPPAARKKSAKV